VVQKTSRKNVTSTVLIFLLFCPFDGRHGWKNHIQLKRTALKFKKKERKKEKHAHRKRARSALSRERIRELRQ